MDCCCDCSLGDDTGRIFWLYLRSEGVVCFVHTVKLLWPRGTQGDPGEARGGQGRPGELKGTLELTLLPEEDGWAVRSWNNIRCPQSSPSEPFPASYSGGLNDVSSRITLIILQIFYHNIFLNIHPADTSLSTFSEQHCCVGVTIRHLQWPVVL